MKKLFETVIAILMILVFAGVYSVITTIAWNGFVPAIFGLQKINIEQALAMYTLIVLLVYPIITIAKTAKYVKKNQR